MCPNRCLWEFAPLQDIARHLHLSSRDLAHVDAACVPVDRSLLLLSNSFSSWLTALLAKILLPFPVKAPGSGPKTKVTSIIMPSGLCPLSLRNLTSPGPSYRDPRCSNSTPRRHWRTAVGCGHPHLRSDETDIARRRAGIIDFQYCVTCFAAIYERNSLAGTCWPEPAKHDGNVCRRRQRKPLFPSPSPQMVLQHVRLCRSLLVAVSPRFAFFATCLASSLNLETPQIRGTCRAA
ncbi:hypothetical protein V8C26DRAFT_286660 [Trichoderma gracile]